MRVRTAASAVALLGVLSFARAVKRLDLMASEGDVAGKYAFDGGEPEATCKACKAVMEHIEREMAKPYYDEYHHTYKEKQRRGVDARRLNKIDRIGRILDPNTCRKEMNSYDLAYIGGQNVFHYNPKGHSGMAYPVHMELNDWAKNELGAFCESLLEEYEDELTALLMEEDDEAAVVGKPNATMRVCKEQLALCVPPPPPPPPPKPKKQKPKTRQQILDEARRVFKEMDADGNGYVSEKEMEQRLQRMASAGQLGEGKTVDGELEAFFSSVDKDKDRRVTFYEYKFLWVQPKNKAGTVPGAEETSAVSLEYYLGATLAASVSALPGVGDLAQTAPGVVLGGLAITSVAACAGGYAALR